MMEAYQRWRGWADPKVCCDYSFHMAVTYWDNTVADQMQQICSRVEEGGAGINSFKMFMVRVKAFLGPYYTLTFIPTFIRFYVLIKTFPLLGI